MACYWHRASAGCNRVETNSTHQQSVRTLQLCREKAYEREQGGRGVREGVSQKAKGNCVDVAERLGRERERRGGTVCRGEPGRAAIPQSQEPTSVP